MIIGTEEWFRGEVWESGLGEQLERNAVKVKNTVKIFFQCAKNFWIVERESSLKE